MQYTRSGQQYTRRHMSTTHAAVKISLSSVSIATCTPLEPFVPYLSSTGMMAGSMYWSIMADRHGRRPTFMLSLLVVFIAGIGSALAPSFLLFFVFRVVVGFGVGGNLPVAASLTTEFMPTSVRATALLVVTGVVWGVGQVCASAIGLLLSSVIGYR